MVNLCEGLHEFPQTAWKSSFIEAFNCHKHPTKENQKRIGNLAKCKKKDSRLQVLDRPVKIFIN
jgi:hypothetical protein